MTPVIPAALALAGLAGLWAVGRLEAAWAASLAAAGLAFGALSPVVAARRAGFLAAAAPHAALLAAAAALALPLPGQLAGPASLALGMALVYAVGYAVHRGADPETATYVFVGSTASLSVAALYYVATHGPGGYAVSAVMLGDPLLATGREAATALGLAALASALALATLRYQFYLGFDRDDLRLAGAPVWAYDLAFYTSLGLAAVGLIRVVGFVLEHVLVLLPAALSFRLASRPHEAAALSVAAGMAAVGLGGALALRLDVAPAAAAGATLLILYILTLLAPRRWGLG